MAARNQTETRIHRKLTREFINAEPQRIKILRPNLVQTPAGGLTKSDPHPLEEQTFRLVPFKKRLTKMTRDTPDGNIINLEYVLIGEYDADVKPGDYFEFETGMYDVISIEPNRAYRTAANVTYRGKNDETWAG